MGTQTLYKLTPHPGIWNVILGIVAPCGSLSPHISGVSINIYRSVPTIFITSPNSIHSSCSARKVDLWRDIPHYVLEERGPFYDRGTSIDRESVDISELDMLDETGDEIPIYSEDGRRVPRREPLSMPERGYCAVLMELTNSRELFDDPHSQDALADVEGSPPPYVIVNAYRQGFLHSAGHLQVNAVPFPMLPLIADINASVAFDNDPPADDEDVDDHVPSPMTAVTGVDCQMYNAVMHRVRGTASTHDAQRGDITAALAGSFAKGAAQMRKATRFKNTCNTRLPHENFSLLIDHQGLDTSLRMECVHRIDLTKLRDDRRSGRCGI